MSIDIQTIARVSVLSLRSREITGPLSDVTRGHFILCKGKNYHQLKYQKSPKFSNILKFKHSCQLPQKDADLMVWFGFVKAEHPSKQFFSHVGTEPPLPGYYQYFLRSKCVFAQGHNTAEVGIKPLTSCSQF